MTSSLYFTGTTSSYLSIPNDTKLQFGTGDFTIQWFQYLISDTSAPRIFQQGNYQDPNNGNTNDIKIGVSLEGSNASNRIFYFWNPSFNSAATINPSTFLNKWTHFAISRKNNKTRFFINGVLVYSISSDNTNFNYSGSIPLCIGNESVPTTAGIYGGYIYGFCWIKGESLYFSDSSFTVPSTLPTGNPNAVLILTGSGFSGSLGNTVVNHSVSTVNIIPPSIGTTVSIPMIITSQTNKIIESQKRKKYTTTDTSHSSRVLAVKTNTNNTLNAINSLTAATIATASANNPIFNTKNATEKKSATTAIRRVRAGGSTVPSKVTKAYLI
jgi:Concanavalin A-like lectin/glucanases superfamily